MSSRGLVAIAITALIGVGCAGTGPAAPAPTAAATTAGTAVKETPEQLLARLYEAAKPEAKVAFYSSMNNQDAAKILPEFEKKFPGLKVEHTRASSEPLVQRLVTEKKAGQNLFDVLETDFFESYYVVQQGCTQKYQPASWDDYADQVKDKDGAWIAPRRNANIPGINTQKLPQGVVVKTWKDMCDKRLEAKIAVEQGDISVYAGMKKALGEKEAQDTLKCIAANKPSLRSGHTEMANLLAAGEFAITYSSNGHRLAQLKYEEKKPIDWARTPVVITDVQAMAIADKPAHPNAAKLFVEWYTSVEGQTALAATGRLPSSSKVRAKYPDQNDFAPPLYLGPELRQDFDKDAEFWRSTLGIK